MHPILYNPKLKRVESPMPLLPNLLHMTSDSAFFPNFHTSFLKKNNQLKKLPYSSFDHKPDSHLSNRSKINLSKDSKFKPNETKDSNFQGRESTENRQRIKESRETINEICNHNRKFQKTLWMGSIPNRTKYTFHEETEKPDLEKFRERQVNSFSQKNPDVEIHYPEFVTKNTVESETLIQKRIDFLKENIKKKDVRFRKYNPKLQVRKQRVVKRDLGESAKEVHYLVYNFEKHTEEALIRRSRGKSVGITENKDDYSDFTKRHKKNLTTYNKSDRNFLIVPINK